MIGLAFYCNGCHRFKATQDGHVLRLAGVNAAVNGTRCPARLSPGYDTLLAMDDNREQSDVTTGVPGEATRWKPGQSGNPKGRPKSPSFRALIQAADELKKQEVVDRMYVIAVKGRPVDAARAAEWLAKHSDDKADVKFETEDFTITIAPSAAMEEEEEDEAEDGG